MTKPKNNKKRYLSPREVEEQYPFSRWTVRTWAYTGKIASVKIGGHGGRLLIPVSEIERIIAEGTRPRVPAA
jgi:predicted site-specific integrase-resolvase